MVVLETANLTEIEFSEYCREKGIYLEQVKEWKEKVEKELVRKEKALAEAAALLVLRKKADAMRGATMVEPLYALGITPSKSRPWVSNDNPYAESLFKTLKYVPNFQPQGFATLTEARLWVKRFMEW